MQPAPAGIRKTLDLLLISRLITLLFSFPLFLSPLKAVFSLVSNGMTLSNSSIGKPIQLHGVADATSDFDAVNYRQFGKGIASIAAMSNVPEVPVGKDFSLGLGVGNYDGYSAVALGISGRPTDDVILKASLPKGSNTPTIAGLGLGWAF